LQSGIEKLLARPGLEPTTLNVSSLSGAFDDSARGTTDHRTKIRGFGSNILPHQQFFHPRFQKIIYEAPPVRVIVICSDHGHNNMAKEGLS